MDSEEDPLNEEYIRAHYGIVEPLTGDELNAEAERIERQRNADFLAAQK